MSKVKVCAFSVSLDGYAAGPNQSLKEPLGKDGELLHEWFFPTHIFQKMHGGGNAGVTGVDNDFAERSFENLGAWIMGRNMFGPVRGRGSTTIGKGGGAKIHLTMYLCLC